MGPVCAERLQREVGAIAGSDAHCRLKPVQALCRHRSQALPQSPRRSNVHLLHRHVLNDSASPVIAVSSSVLADRAAAQLQNAALVVALHPKLSIVSELAVAQRHLAVCAAPHARAVDAARGAALLRGRERGSFWVGLARTVALNPHPSSLYL